MKNYRTPRTISECEWACGHPAIERRQTDWRSAVLAVAIGVALAWALIYGWAP
jgi:hypothetical protein